MAGAWPAKKGHGFFQITSKIIKSDTYYTPSGETAPIPTVLDITNGLYGEVGMFKNTALTFNLGLFKYWSLNEQVRYNPGLDD